jgi:hypothetical protein
MKNLMRITLLAVMAIAIAAMSGCSKDDKEENQLDKKALLTAHVWKFDKLTTTSADADIQLVVNLMGAFMTGATLDYSSNGTYTISILGETQDGTWELSADETKITVDKGTEDEIVHTIVTLTSDVLEFNEPVDEEEYDLFNVTYRWVK